MAKDLDAESSTDFQREIGARIRQARLVKERQTGTKIADDLGVKRQTWYNWEAGLRAFDHAIIAEFCRRYRISPDWIYGMPWAIEATPADMPPPRRSSKRKARPVDK